MSFGDKLFQLRTERGIYQKELAEYLAVSIGTISNYENCVHSPDLETLCRFAEYFQVSTDFLLELTDNAETMENLNVQLSESHTVGNALNAIQELSMPGRQKIIKYLTMINIYEEMPKKERIIGKQKQIIDQQALEISRLKERLESLEKNL